MTSAKLLTLAIGALFVAISLHFVASAPSPDDRDFGDDVQEFGENVQTTLTDEWTKIYGGQCQNDDQCSVISTCRTSDNTCFFSWWIILAVVAVIVALVSSLCCCLCCPCCCLFGCCEALFCCC